MDTNAASEGNPEETEPGRSPSIGVPSIPPQAEPARPPAPVPSVPLPSEAVPPTGTESGAAAPDRPATDRPPARGASGRPTTPVRRAVPVVSTRTSPLPAERVGRASPSTGTGRPADAAHHEGNPAVAPSAVTGPSLPAGSDPFGMAFPPGVAAKLGWYVYLLVRTRTPAGPSIWVGDGATAASAMSWRPGHLLTVLMPPTASEPEPELGPEPDLAGWGRSGHGPG